ncbi:hypothetical protein PQX77_014129 [Marasmius sp. AFHP31]|nr:hypothetical protein PQX77_014129 [Marasmius sp. AFHP31]
MPGSQLLMNGNNIQIGDCAAFSNVGRDQVTIYNDSGRESRWVTLNGDTYRRFHMGEIILKRNVSSTVMTVTVDTQRNCGTSQGLRDLKALKVRKTTQHIGLLGLPGGFTGVKFETVDKDQAEELSNIMDRLCREVSSQRSPLITQLVGLSWSERPTFIFHDELANGDKYIDEIIARDNWVVYYYLYYTQRISFFTLDDDKSLGIPVSPLEMFWTFNPRTHAWQYDVASVSISPPNDDISLDPLSYPPAPLCQDTRPPLDADGIVACFEEQFGDFLHLVASLGQTRHVKDLSEFSRHGFLTFGAVVDRNKPEILAYFPSTPSPEWKWNDFSADVEVNYSASVPSRIDLSFQTPNSNQVHLDFSLSLPDPPRRRNAYLCQSVLFAKDCDDCYNDLVFIDEVQLSLVGTFHHNPTRSTTPAYLFVPPIPVELVDNVYCMHYPLPDTLFFWCSDPNGQNVVYKEDWEAYGIPQLEVLTWIGTSWGRSKHVMVRSHLQKKSCSQDGMQYAWDHDYHKLTYGAHCICFSAALETIFMFIAQGDPHNPSVMVMEEPDTTQESKSSPERSEYREQSNPGDDDNSVSVNSSSNEDQEIQRDEPHQFKTGAVTASPIKGKTQGPVPPIIRKPAPSRCSPQSQQNESRPPVWPRAIYELLVLVWSIAAVVLSVGFGRAIRVVCGTS